MNKKGFTITELLVVIAIITIVSAVFVVNFRKGEEGGKLQRSAQLIVQGIRRAQNMALSSTEIEGVIYNYYGVYFYEDMLDYFYVFANNDEVYNQNAKVAELIKLEDNIVIDSFSTPIRLNITFQPPYSFIKFNPNAIEVTIAIKKKNRACPQDCRYIKINNKGWMSISATP